MPTSFKYRLLEAASWGIAIDVRGEALPLPAAPMPPGAGKIGEGLWLQVDIGWPLTEEELGYLRLGLQLVAAKIAQRRSEACAPLGSFEATRFQPLRLPAGRPGRRRRRMGGPGVRLPQAGNPGRV